MALQSPIVDTVAESKQLVADDISLYTSGPGAQGTGDNPLPHGGAGGLFNTFGRKMDAGNGFGAAFCSGLHISDVREQF